MPIDKLEDAEYRSIVILRHSVEAKPFQAPQNVLKVWLSLAPSHQGRFLHFTEHFPPWRWTQQRAFNSRPWESGEPCLGQVVCDGSMRFRVAVLVSADGTALKLLQASQEIVLTELHTSVSGTVLDPSSKSSLEIGHTLVQAKAVTSNVMRESFHKIKIAIEEPVGISWSYAK